jgi:hypothetical protein
MTLTASLIVGDLHPTRHELIPRHAIEVYESGTATLCVRPLIDEGPAQIWHAIHPEQLTTTLFAAMALVLPDFEHHPINQCASVDFDQLDLEHVSDLAAFTRSQGNFAMAVTLHNGSTLRTEDLQGVTRATLHIFTQTHLQEPRPTDAVVEDLAFGCSGM